MNPLFYFLLAVTAVSAANAFGPVFDTDGDIIFSGSYYVLPVFRGRGGGVGLAGRGDRVCPLDIVQESIEVDDGLPVKFSNWRPKVPFVPESEDLNIETDVTATICVQSTYWQIGEYDPKRKQYFLVAGSKPEGYEEDSFKSFFRIEKAGENAYKFVICPGTMICSNVGIFVDEKGVRRLAIRSEPFLVMFKKANVNELSAKTM